MPGRGPAATSSPDRQRTDLPDVQRIAQEIRDAVAAQHMPHAHSKVVNVVTVSQGYCWGVLLEYRKL